MLIFEKYAYLLHTYDTYAHSCAYVSHATNMHICCSCAYLLHVIHMHKNVHMYHMLHSIDTHKNVCTCAYTIDTHKNAHRYACICCMRYVCTRVCICILFHVTAFVACDTYTHSCNTDTTRKPNKTAECVYILHATNALSYKCVAHVFLLFFM